MKKYWIILLAAVVLLAGFSLATTEAAKAAEEEIQLLYDDRKDLAQLLGVEVGSVSISNEQVTSKAVGTNTPDAHVLQYENGILYATGTGSATLTVNGTDYTVSVDAAPISLFLITGHSVGIGEQGNAAQSVAIEPGQAYSSHRYWTFENVDSEEKDLVIVPSEVTETTGLGYKAENRLSGIDAFAAGNGGTIGEGSALAWRWNQLTGEKVWVINAARGGSCLNHWIPDAEGPVPSTSNRFYGYFKYLYNSSRDAFQNAQAIMKNEIAAGHYTLSHMAMFYHNGANASAFSGWTYSKIEEYYSLMWNSFKTDLSTDMDGDGRVETLETMGLVPHWFNSSAMDLAFDRIVSYYMAASDDYPDVFTACDITRRYRVEADLANFPDILYTTQSTAVSKPVSLLSTKNGGSSDNSFFCYNDLGHLSQVTYNAQGIEIADNMYAYLYETDHSLQAQLVGYNTAALQDSYQLAVGETLYVVPMVQPMWHNDFTMAVTGDITLEYPGCVVAQKAGSGMLTLSRDGQVLQTVEFTVTDGHTHCICVNADVLPEGHVCNNAQVWSPVTPVSNAIKLEQDGYYVLDWTGKKASSIQVADGVDAYLCLNGATVYAKKTVTLGIRSSLTICDCSTGQQGTITVSGTAVGAPIWLDGIKTVTLLSGRISGTANNKSVPAVAMTSSYSNFYMYGGTLSGGVAKANNDTTNPLESYGGTVQIKRGTFTIYAGTIEGGTSTTYGGTVAVGTSDASFTMYGGIVKGGTATTHGGTFGCGNGTVTIYDGTIEGGTATTYGGTASVVNNTKLYIYGGSFTNGTAKQYTNGIYTNKSGITLGGDPEIGEIFLRDGAKLNFSTTVPFASVKSIGIKMTSPDNTIATVGVDYANAFVSHHDGYGVYYNGTDLKLTAHVAQVGNQTYATLAEALVAGDTVRLLQDVTNETALRLTQDLYLDLNGCDLSGLDLNGYTLYGMDSATKAYDGTNAGSMSNVTGTNVLAQDGYLAYEDQTWSFHAYELKLVAVSLKADDDALGYKAQFFGDDVVCSMVTGYGFEMGVESGVTKTFTETEKQLTNGQTFTLRLKNIMGSNGGEMAIIAKAFVSFSNEETAQTDSHSTTMKDIIETVNTNFDGYSDAQKAAVKALVTKYESKMSDWNIDTIQAWTVA